MRRIIFSALVLSGVIANAQNDYYGRMGLNTETPRATLEVKATSHNKAQGILFPTVTETVKNKWAKDNAKGLVAGTVVWNETKKCLDYFDGTNWICTDGTKKNVHGTDWDGTNSGGGSGSGTGSLGTSLPAEIVVSNGSHWIASIDDNNYLPFTAPASTDTASWTRRSNPNTTGTPNTTINVQGKIPAAGITVSIPVTVTGTGSYQLPAYSYEISTVAEAWKDNTAKTLVLSWTAQTLTSANKTITATLKVKGATADQNITQLDLREGLGGDYKGLLLGQFKMPKNNTEATNSANWTGTYDVRVISGIPDRNFDKMTNGSYKHQFIYTPVVSPVNGSVWLNNNLGANYANVNMPDVFNPAKQAENAEDVNAVGSYFQWQRKADGHEFRDSGTTTNIGDWNASHGLWINDENRDNYNSWVSPWLITDENDVLWQKNGANNPCPIGFHVPTKSDFVAIVGSFRPGIYGHQSHTSQNPRNADFLKLPNSYRRDSTWDTAGEYWLSTPLRNDNDWGTDHGRIAELLTWWDGDVRLSWDTPMNGGASVRCVMD